MEKKYFYVDNLHKYGERLYYKKWPKDWIFNKLSEKVYCLYSEKTKKIVMSKKHPKDKPDIFIAFAICYHKYMGLPEPKERTHVEEKIAGLLEIGEKFYLAGAPRQELRCCGWLEDGTVLYEFTNEKGLKYVIRLASTASVFVKKEN